MILLVILGVGKEWEKRAKKQRGLCREGAGRCRVSSSLVLMVSHGRALFVYWECC